MRSTTFRGFNTNCRTFGQHRSLSRYSSVNATMHKHSMTKKLCTCSGVSNALIVSRQNVTELIRISARMKMDVMYAARELSGSSKKIHTRSRARRIASNPHVLHVVSQHSRPRVVPIRGPPPNPTPAPMEAFRTTSSGLVDARLAWTVRVHRLRQFHPFLRKTSGGSACIRPPRPAAAASRTARSCLRSFTSPLPRLSGRRSYPRNPRRPPRRRRCRLRTGCASDP